MCYLSCINRHRLQQHAFARAEQDDAESDVLLLRSTHLELARRDANGWTPAHYSCSCGDLLALRMLVAAGAPLLSRNNKGELPLHFFIKSYQFQAAPGVHASGQYYINALTRCVRSPIRVCCVWCTMMLWWCVDDEWREMLELLLSTAPASATIPDNNGVTPLAVACGCAPIDVVRKVVCLSRLVIFAVFHNCNLFRFSGRLYFELQLD